MKLSSYALGTPNDAYTQSKVLQYDWLILENNEKATLNIKMP